MTLFPGSKYTYLAVIAGNILAFISGTAMAWSSPVIALLENEDIDKLPLGRHITKEEESWIGSLSAIGGICGPFIFGFLVQNLGRKTAMAAAAIPFLVAYTTIAFAKTIWLYYIGRFLMGMGVGGTFCTVPVFIVETVEDVNRGLLMASKTTFITSGLLFTYSVGPYVSITVFNLILASICLFYIPFLLYFAPETPYFLASQGKEEESYNSLQYLRRRSSKDLRKELKNVVAYVGHMKPGSFMDLIKTKTARKSFFYSIILTTWQQCSGIHVVVFYTQNIFSATGSTIPSEISSIIIGAVQFVVSFFSPLLLDRVGRKKLLLGPYMGASLSHVLLGTYFYLQNDGVDVSSVRWIPIIALVAFMTFYNLGISAVSWTMLGEFLPPNIISKGILIATSIYWTIGFFLTKYFGSLSDVIGMAGSFWIFAGLCAIFDVFVVFFIFETKGKSLVEIQAILSRKSF